MIIAENQLPAYNAKYILLYFEPTAFSNLFCHLDILYIHGMRISVLR